MDKLYITKSDLQKLFEKTTQQSLDHPKPLLFLLTVIVVLLVVLIMLILMFVIIAFAILYAVLGWIDLIIGKYILKRIFKL